jgi:predicted RNase H-like nuclease
VTSYLGLDLAWGERNRTGVAALDGAGRLVASGIVRTDAEVAAFAATHAPDPVVVGIDAPLVVPNATGRRGCEAQLAHEFARFHAGPHPSNRSRPWFDPPRAQTLARRLGWDVDPATVPGRGRSVVVEVYPHPAMVRLFGLARVIPYKQRGARDVDILRVATGDLLRHMEAECEVPLRLSASRRWAEIRAQVASARRKADLRLVEDEIDAVFCAYLAWRWGQQDGWLRVVGDVRSGYILAPDPPVP